MLMYLYFDVYFLLLFLFHKHCWFMIDCDGFIDDYSFDIPSIFYVL